MMLRLGDVEDMDRLAEAIHALFAAEPELPPAVPLAALGLALSERIGRSANPADASGFFRSVFEPALAAEVDLWEPKP